MKTATLTISFLFSVIITSAQLKEISLDIIENTRVKQFIIMDDSLLRYYNDPLIEVFDFSVYFEKAFIDSSSGIIRLAGKVCFSSDSNKCVGMGGIEIFKGRSDGWSTVYDRIHISNTTHISITTKGSRDNKEGLFDFTVRIRKGESIFFRIPYFYIREYKIGNLFPLQFISHSTE